MVMVLRGRQYEPEGHGLGLTRVGRAGVFLCLSPVSCWEAQDLTRPSSGGVCGEAGPPSQPASRPAARLELPCAEL